MQQKASNTRQTHNSNFQNYPKIPEVKTNMHTTAVYISYDRTCLNKWTQLFEIW